MTKPLLWVPVAFVVLMTLLLVTFMFRQEDPAIIQQKNPADDPLIDRALPELNLADFPGAPEVDIRALGKPYLLNIWASWCPPCYIEHPFLMELSRLGVPIYGIVYKDDPDDAKRFLQNGGNPYIALKADPTGLVGVDLGITSVPETFLIDANGKIRMRWRGPLTDINWQKNFLPLWADLNQTPKE